MSSDAKKQKSIVRNYIEYLACEDFSLKVCDDESDCKEDVTILNCNLNVVGISFNLVQDGSGDIVFFLGVGNIYGATTPLKYKWIFENDDFTLVGEDDDPTVKLKLKSSKVLTNLVTKIGIEVTDANGCTDTKYCWYTPTGMRCNNNFAPCVNPINLKVKSTNVTCVRTKNLSVNKL